MRILPALTTNEMPLLEPSVISDTFCSELAYVERVGPCLRLVFAVAQGVPGMTGDRAGERHVTAKIILPADAAAAVIDLLAKPAKPIAAPEDEACGALAN